MKTFKVKKTQTITDDVPGDVVYTLTVNDPDAIIGMTKYIDLSKAELNVLTHVLSDVLKK